MMFRTIYDTRRLSIILVVQPTYKATEGKAKWKVREAHSASSIQFFPRKRSCSERCSRVRKRVCSSLTSAAMASSTHFSWRGGGAEPQLQSSGMLTKDQLLQLFQDFAAVLALPETKSRLAGCIRDMQEAVNVTTEIQEELFLNMGVDPKFGIESLGKVNTVYADDRDLMIQFYQFVSGEEMACEEAELGPEAFARRMEDVKKSQQQQMAMLRQLRSVPLDEQRAFFQGLQAKMHETQNEGGAPMTSQEIQEFFEHRYGLDSNAN